MRDRILPTPQIYKTDVHFCGRWWLYADRRWVLPPWWGGFSQTNLNQPAGYGADPNIAWSIIGLMIRAGERVRKLSMLGRIDVAQFDYLDFRLYYLTGPNDGSWVNQASATTTLLGQVDIELNTFEMRSTHLEIDFTAPQDGFLIPAVKPNGTATTRRHYQMDGIIDIERS